MAHAECVHVSLALPNTLSYMSARNIGNGECWTAQGQRACRGVLRRFCECACVRRFTQTILCVHVCMRAFVCVGQ